MKRGKLLLLGLLLTAPVLLAQEGPAVFDSREWDFGSIREADGVVSHAFTVFNSSDRPLRLSRAIPGCSCISATLPRADIAPGQSATVEVRFTPAGASGPVIRTIELQAAGGRSLGVLSVSADVFPADRSIQERYPVVLAEGLYASRADVRFGYLERGRASGKVIFIANASERPMRLRVAGLDGTHFRVRCPDSLAPGEESRVEVWCDTPADPSLFATLRASLRLTPDGVPALREMPVSGLCLTQAPESPDAPRLRNAAVQLRKGLLSGKLHGALENQKPTPSRTFSLKHGLFKSRSSCIPVNGNVFIGWSSSNDLAVKVSKQLKKYRIITFEDERELRKKYANGINDQRISETRDRAYYVAMAEVLEFIDDECDYEDYRDELQEYTDRMMKQRDSTGMYVRKIDKILKGDAVRGV